MAASLASLSKPEIEDWLASLSPQALAALPYMFELWAAPGHQLPPDGDWRVWLILGGRGAGKTRAGAEWVRAQAEGATPLGRGRARRICLLAETLEQAQEVMIRGDSGILACSPADRRPRYDRSRRTLVWPNGAEAACFSASSPERLRGPQFDAAWADELGKWRKARAAWDQLQFALRLGEAPRAVVTTTPRANKVLEDLIENPDVAVCSAPTAANAANLAAGFLEDVQRRYGGTAMGRRELDGEMVLDRPGALWTRALIEARRKASPDALRRIVVAVDPPATAGENADECGVVVAGLGEDGAAYVLADRSSQGETPAVWAARAVSAWREHEADRIVAEVNQGGDLVEATIRQVDPNVPYRAVRATRGKRARAEPVSALYEQGRVFHAGAFPELEDQMCAFGADDSGGGSPDRVDALVWAITDLLLSAHGAPRARRL